jgi:hypothetical protein
MHEIFADGPTAVIAGSDTTATAFDVIIHYLLLNRAMFERLQAEVDIAFPQGQQPSDFTKMANMPYLNACLLSFFLAPCLVGSQVLIIVVSATRPSALSLQFPAAYKGVLHPALVGS